MIQVVNDPKVVSLQGGEVLRFGLVGIALNALAFGAYLFLADFLEVDPRLSIGLVQVVFLPVSYIAQKIFTFRSRGYARNGLMLYALGYFGSVAFQIVNLYLFHTVLQFPHQVVAAVGLVVAVGGFYVVQRNFVFSERDQ